MNPEIKAAWIAKLRSGEFEQGLGLLRDKDDKLCCLGVLCELGVEAGIVKRNQSSLGEPFAYGEMGMTGLLPSEVIDWSGIYENSPWVHLQESNDDYSLTQLNDSWKFNFTQIADAIEGDEKI